MNTSFSIKTIGVYGSTENEFFEKLIGNKIDTFLDIRKRRGVRGSKYAFVNSKRLQDRLKELNINYIHEIDLAPTNEIRELQKSADKNNGILKRDRNCLGPEFILAYQEEIINNFNFESLLKKLTKENAKNVALFCVENEPEACHRSIVANHLMLNHSIEAGDI